MGCHFFSELYDKAAKGDYNEITKAVARQLNLV